MEKPLKIRLQTLSPVHIGCGDVYEPANFVIDENRQALIAFDPLELVDALNRNEKNELTDVCMGNDLLKVFKFIKKSYKPHIGGREVEIAPALMKQYRKILSMQRFDKKTVINQFEIGRTAYNPHNNIPYIPGSSLKGALRTAYLGKIAKDKGVRRWWELPGRNIRNKRLSRELEENLLKGSFNADPFRLVKISDLQLVNGVRTKIVYAVNKKKKRSRFAARDPFQILETIQGREIFEGTINIEKPEKGSGISGAITKENLLNSLNYFYISICEHENDTTLRNINASSQVLNSIHAQYKDTIGVSTFPVRLGRHSGAESVTIENNRHIKIKGKGSSFRFEDKATTIWLASDSPNPENNRDLLPFGWAILTLGEEDKIETIINKDDIGDQETLDDKIKKLVSRFS